MTDRSNTSTGIGQLQLASPTGESGPAAKAESARARPKISKRSDRQSSFYTLASIAIVVATFYLAQSVIIPLALAMLLAFLLAPLVTQAERWGLHRVAATLVSVVATLAIVASIAWTMERQFANLAGNLPEYRQSIASKFDAIWGAGRFDAIVRGHAQQTDNKISGPITAATQPLAGGPPHPADDVPWAVKLVSDSATPVSLAVEYLGGIIGRLLTALIVIVFAIFILLQREDLRERMILLLGEGHLSTTTEALDEAAHRVSRFLIAESLINLAFGALVALGVWIIYASMGGNHTAVRVALLAGGMCAALRFVPYVGIWIGASLPLAIAFAAFPGYGAFLATLALFVGLEFLTGQFIEPRLLGCSTGLSPIAVLAAALFWTWLWGPIGLLLSMPLTVLLVLVGKYVPQLEFLDVLLAEKSTLDPPMRIYQRLIAGDDENAIEIAAEYLTSMPLERIYDEVLLPSLVTAQRDWHHGRLNDEQYEFNVEAMREIVEAVADKAAQSPLGPATEKEQPPSCVLTAAEEAPAAAMPLPRGADLHVLCLPARDEADEVVGHMMRRLLEARGYRVSVISAAALASEMIDLIEGQSADAVIISALPPQAASHARYLVKRLQARHPDLKIVMGLWMSSCCDAESRPGQSAPPVARLWQALEQMEQMSHSMLIKSNLPESSAAPTSELEARRAAGSPIAARLAQRPI
jgi:predicted PurR-regulated permease PerM